MKIILRRTIIFTLLIFNFQCSNFNSFAQSPNSWIRRADFPGTPRISSVAFSIGTKGYIGTGQDSSGNLLSDFWEYNPSSDSWTQLADFAGSARRGAVGFAIGSNGYIGTGNDGTNDLLDFWEYNSSFNSWVQKRSLGIATTNPRRDAASFAINNKGYVATGYDGTIKYSKECWQFDGDTTWIKKADVGSGAVTENWRRWAVGFAIDTTGYLGCGFNYSQDWRKDFWRYNAGTNTWTQVANYGGTARSNAIGFSVQGKGYVGTGTDMYFRNDFWQFDPANNSWLQVADYPAGTILGGIGFSINGSGYAGLGRDSLAYRNDFWQYTPDSTIGINEFPGSIPDAYLFPNPCAEKLTVESFVMTRINTITVYNSAGEKIAVPFYFLKNHQALEINTSSLSPGQYFLILQSDKGKVVKKFVKD